MNFFTLQTELWLPRPRDEVFGFFAEARNLEALTPRWLKFEVLTAGCIDMRPGALIDYRIRVHGIPIHWLFVRRDVDRIFHYRQQRLKELFP